MRRILIFLVAALVALLIPAAALADDGTDQGGFTLRVNGDYHLVQGETVKRLLVIDGDATIDGTVTNSLWVINGDAVVHGNVEGDTTVIRGTLEIAATGTVDNVALFRVELIRHTGATVTGDIDRTNDWFWPGAVFFGVMFVLGTGVAIILGGLAFAAVGGKQLTTAAVSMGRQPARTIFTGIAFAIGLPIVAVIAMVTIIGIPTGLALLVFLLPAMGYLGYVVAGTWIGMLILGRTGRAGTDHKPFGEVALGLAIMQFLALIPGIAFATFIVMGTWGTGALALMIWHAIRPPRRAEPTAAAPAATGGMATPA